MSFNPDSSSFGDVGILRYDLIQTHAASNILRMKMDKSVEELTTAVVPGPYKSKRVVSWSREQREVFAKGTPAIRLNVTTYSIVSSFPLLEVLISGQILFIPQNLIEWK